MDDKGNAPLLETIDLKKYFKVGGGTLHAVDSINIKLYQGETLGVVGESGCGKSTLGRTILKLIEPTAGHIIYDGKDITSLNIRKMRPLRREMQIIFQDPYSSIDPRKSVIETISEYMFIHKSYPTRREIMNRAVELMDRLGLPDVTLMLTLTNLTEGAVNVSALRVRCRCSHASSFVMSLFLHLICQFRPKY